MIYVIATVELRAGKREVFLDEFHRLMPQVHAEAGCLEYGPAIDIATDIPVQVPLRSEVVTIIERWESLAHLQAHLSAPHMVTYRQRVKDFVDRVTLQVLSPA